MCVRCDRETKRPLSARAIARVGSHAWTRVPETVGRHRTSDQGASLSLVLLCATACLLLAVAGLVSVFV